MEVTRSNFDSVLNEVLEEIEKCSFASTDLEISGLWRKGEPGPLDSQEKNYTTFLHSAKDFICLQLGLSLFTFQPKSSKYRIKTYCFYVFPHQVNRGSSFSFSCQASSLQFLVSNNFDFNKVFYEGVPYLNSEGELELNQSLEEKRYFRERSQQAKEDIEIPPEHVELVNQTCEELSSVLEKEGCEEVEVPGLNAYIRRLVYQTMKQRFPKGEVLVDTRSGNLVSRKGQVDGHIPKSQLEIDDEQIDKAVGFSKVIRALSKSGKLIVGHNMFLDLCHIINNFLCSAPPTYSEFRELVKGVFPMIIDTKFMVCSEGLTDLISGSTLSRLYSRIKECPFSYPDTEAVEGYSYSQDVEKFHDAGFDSYITGIVFISLYNYLAGTKHSNASNIPLNPKCQQLKRFLNRIYLNNSVDSHVYFGGDDPEPDRSHYFHVTFPKEWVSKDIFDVFNAYSRVNISWIDSTSAWVSLHEKSKKEVIKSVLCQDGLDIVVTPYSTDLFKSIEERQRLNPTRHKRPRSSINHGSCDENKSKAESKDEEQVKSSVLGKRTQSERTSCPPRKRKASQPTRVSDSFNQDSAIAELERGLAKGQSGSFASSDTWD